MEKWWNCFKQPGNSAILNDVHALPHFWSYLHRNGLKHRLLFTVSVMIFFFIFADSVMTYLLPIIITHHGFDKTQMGLIIGSSSLFGAAFDFVLSKYVRKPYYRRLYPLVLLGAATFGLVLYQARSFGMFMLAMAIWGIYWDLYHFANFDLVGRTVPERDHAGAFGVIGVFHSLGNLLAPVIVGLLLGVGAITTVPLQFVWMLIGLAFIFYGVIYWQRSPSEKTQTELALDKHSWWQEISIWLKIGKQIWPLLALLFLVFSTEAFFWTIGPLIAEQPEFGVFGGLLLTAFSLPMLIVGWFVGRITHHHSKKRVAMLAFLGGSVIVSFLPLFSQPAWMIGLVALAASFLAFTLPSINGALADYIFEAKAYEKEIQSLSDLFYNLGWAIGPMASGFLADAVGNKSVFAILGITSTLACLILLKVTPRKITIHVE